MSRTSSILGTTCLLLLLLLGPMPSLQPYPIDGFSRTQIRRLLRLERLREKSPPQFQALGLAEGALHAVADINLNLSEGQADSLSELPAADPTLQKAVDRLFPNLDESYALALLDISSGKPVRYAQRKATRGFQPGSVGKLAVAAGFFTELARIYPDSFDLRLDLMCTHEVKAGKWALPNEHTVPFYDPETEKFFKRTLQEQDVFTLFEWLDHMLSVSSNGAASVVWREAILMRAFGVDYPALEPEARDEFFKTIARDSLQQLTLAVVNEPLRALGISEDEWRLGSLFTAGGKQLAPGGGGSTGSPLGLMKFLLALERGQLVDPLSSLELKRLMYMTDRRIRYAASPALKPAKVFFKSGSLYKCRPEEGYACGKYKGNVDNYMNSVAIVEHPDGTTYLVVLMSNVLKKNSASDHMALASQIDRLIRMP